MNKAAFRILFIYLLLSVEAFAQNPAADSSRLSTENRHIVTIAVLAAQGELEQLKPALQTALEAGVTINKASEVMVHLYAYCGFPRSIRGLQTLMNLVAERKAAGVEYTVGRRSSTLSQTKTKYERGSKILDGLTQAPPAGRPVADYGRFAPVIDTFLKEHLFSDLFERDVLTYAERELVTIAVLSSLTRVEPMLKSHFTICRNLGISKAELEDFIRVIRPLVGRRQSRVVKAVLAEVVNRPS